MLRFLSVLSLVVPLCAEADCPNLSDLDTGIKLVDSQGGVEEFRRIDADLVESMLVDQRGVRIRSHLAKGIYLVDVADVVNGRVLEKGRSITSFPISNARLPGPEPETSWTTEVTTSEDGDRFSAREEYKFGTVRSYSIGDCGYTGVPIKITYLEQAKGNFDELIWLSELGFSIVLKESFGVGDADIYRYTSVEALK